ncbi:hypothetical protein LGV61_13255 [Desulfurispirillum indicum]|uniref:hypothetical protein n=1 Tax=Desulfurispirillum indicum TaxID=936456 RepID=UPI001CFA9E44|nr:hypothetical protein [Desulfurispirillum indicum]UCZ56677.1 hypothetical protein LGV61_13255 [Desulfurispirillum indicum]
MSAYLAQHRRSLGVILLFILGVGLSHLLDWNSGVQIGLSFGDSLLEVLSVLPAVFILIGLMDVWIPRDFVQRHTGQDAGLISMLWMVLLAMFQAGPLYVAFPIVYLMWKKGTSVRNIFVYLGAFSTMKLPMLGFEITFLGLQFTIVRSLVTLPVFIVIAIIMDRWFHESFTVLEGGEGRGR